MGEPKGLWISYSEDDWVAFGHAAWLSGLDQTRGVGNSRTGHAETTFLEKTTRGNRCENSSWPLILPG